MHMLNIRPFSKCDLAALREIYLLSRRHAFPWMERSFNEMDFERDTDGEKIWVAVNEQQPIGFVSVWEPENFIHHLFVHPDFMRRGTGSRLLDECLANIGRPAALKCVSRNVIARDFYLARGWKIVSEHDDPDGKYLLMHYDQKT